MHWSWRVRATNHERQSPELQLPMTRPEEDDSVGANCEARCESRICICHVTCISFKLALRNSAGQTAVSCSVDSGYSTTHIFQSDCARSIPTCTHDQVYATCCGHRGSDADKCMLAGERRWGG